MDGLPVILHPEIVPDIDRILYLCDCRTDSPVYDYMRGEAAVVADAVRRAARPAASLAFDGGSAFCVMTVSADASRMSGQYCDSGEYVRGLLADAACDDLITSLDDCVRESLRLQRKQRGVGIQMRLEAPQDIPMDRQKVICRAARAGDIGVTLLESLTLSPVKSACCEYVLSCGDEFNTDHNCGRCPRLDCKLRNGGFINESAR